MIEFWVWIANTTSAGLIPRARPCLGYKGVLHGVRSSSGILGWFREDAGSPGASMVHQMHVELEVQEEE